MEDPHEEEGQAPDTPPSHASHPGTDEDKNDNTVPHTLEFHHAGCPICTTSLTDDTPIITTTSSQDSYQDLTSTMLSRAYDVIDIFHAADGSGPVIRDVKLSVLWTEAAGGRFTDMDTMDYKEREALLGILKKGGDSYRLRVEFVTFPQQTEEIREALDDEGTGMASVEKPGPNVEGTDEN